MTDNSWQTKQFGDCATLVRDTVSPADAVGLSYIGLEHIGAGTLSLIGKGIADDVMSIKARFHVGDILFGKLRPYFRKIIRAQYDGVCSTDIWVVQPKDDIDAGYLFYWMASREFVDASMRGSEGTKMPRAQWDFVSRITHTIPPISEQRAIAHILGTLDDKIELNRRMNETLEGIARALFKSWFVDFDPVRAKAEGRDTGLPKHIADLFPDSFEDSELGEIPEGWTTGTLGDVAENPRRGVHPNEIEPSTPYIALEHMPKNCIALTEWGTAKKIESNKFKFNKGEILFGKLRPYFHKVGIAPVDGVCSTDIVVVTSRSAKWLGFVLGHVSSDAFVEYTSARSTGTKMPRTSWGDMAKYNIGIPSEAIATAFTDIIQPLIARMIFSIHESRALAALRDTLLPKLITGELRVTATRQIVKEA
jgi:type I restriction enzyme S subunit